MKHLLLAFALLLPMTSHAADAVLVRSVTVQGKAEEEFKPDTALVQVSIENDAAALKEAKRLQDEDTKALMKLVDDLDIDKKDVSTQYARINPRHEYDNKTRKNVFKGYRATTNVQIKVRDLDVTGALLDKLVKDGFENINNVRYVLDDDQDERDAVLLKAMDNAKAKATSMAKRYGESLGEAITINEGHVSTPQPIMAQAPMLKSMAVAESAMMADSVAPPEGMIQINSTVTVSFALKD